MTTANRIATTLLLGFTVCYGEAQTTTYSRLDGDTLTIGNRLVERKFVWNNGQLRTHSLTDKQNGRTWLNQLSKPDFYISQEQPQGEGTYSQTIVAETPVRPAYQTTTVTTRIGGLEVLRVYRVYDDCAAIACDTYLRGDATAMLGNNPVTNAADMKNIESLEDQKFRQKVPLLDQLQLGGNHWDMRAVEFFDVTDMNNNLVSEHRFVPFRKCFYRGNLLFAEQRPAGGGLFFLKEAPTSSTQLNYGSGDFIVEFSHFSVMGLGVTAADITATEWTKTYSCVVGVYDGGELGALTTLRSYQKRLRKLSATVDEMVMMNTWGDRSQDTKVNEQFCLREIERGAQLGISHFQIDDGWQLGKSPNSASGKGSFRNIWSNPDYWKPAPEKYPRGLSPIVERGRELGIEVGLWFNPCVQDDYADWEKDAQALIGLHRDYGIRVFKIDGLNIPTKQSEVNLRRLFDRVVSETNHEVMFNLDATAGRRGGYHMFNEYGNIFLENRYTDWGIYYPYQALRNLWQLAKYVPAERIQVEFLNNWRNADKYAADDPFAPHRYTFEYLFATTMAAQPLAWFEATGLPQVAFSIAPVVKRYHDVQHDLHRGTILPVGQEPSGQSWTGFQSVCSPHRGYLIVYREDTPSSQASMKTWLPAGRRLAVSRILGQGTVSSHTVGVDGTISVTIPVANSYALFSYTIEP